MSTKLLNPEYYTVQRGDRKPMQMVVPEGVVLAVFSQPGAADQYWLELGASPEKYDVAEFRTLEEVQRFAQHFGPHFDYVIIDPPIDPQTTPPNLQPFSALLEIAEANTQK